ncbi:D-alanyl-D-alanine carboxypeptidase family protein [Streptomyces rishiriensis]|uniref:D-alanyl-D-alanine carboxypeptidase (Penicillin-binding protein 5/6) n=1 Tax=Streptomyces rishiriensis TaxID=68264 RepID=A0ABU0NJ99_STRRH|nr:D-alanyl-D-alanine carboxypeptidase [Streptomyces rishiriensis]MDQ0579197.1 D-alanyl-D-alanine carboxypeptidase (penicillin-binding protein 5/6) [Streptomyces rishiriensis]
MTIGFSSRAAAATCAFCVAGTLALGLAAGAGADPGAPGGPGGPGAPGGPRVTAPRPSVLYRSGTQVRPHRGAPEVPDVSALSWLVSDAQTGEVLAASNAHRKLPPASTLKTLFALTVLPVLPGEIRHRVSEEELSGIGPGSSLVGVTEGHTYQVADLWRGVFLNSGNDAVHVLASLSGGWRATAARMQAKARSLGALDTHVLSPDGYDTPGQVSSAYDLAVFGRAGLRNPDFARYCGTAEASFPGDGGWSYEIANTNRLLTGADGVEPYPGLIGIKNGYTSNAGNTLVAAARQGDRTLVVTVMNPQDGGGFEVYEEARALLDWGFAAAGRVDPVGSLDALRVRPWPLPGPGPKPASPQKSTPAPGAPPVAVAPPVTGTAAVAAGDAPGWREAALIAGAAVLGGTAVALVLWLAGRRSAGR